MRAPLVAMLVCVGCYRPSETCDDCAVDTQPEMQDAPLDSSPDVAVDTMAGCPIDYDRSFGASTYRLSIATRKPWATAASDCADDGATTHLAVITSEQERSAVQAFSPFDVMWIGLSDLVAEQTLLWVTAEDPGGYPPPAPQPPWQTGEPDVGANERCIELNGTADFANEQCALDRAYVCECDEFANEPARYGM